MSYNFRLFYRKMEPVVKTFHSLETQSILPAKLAYDLIASEIFFSTLA
jgi:hypothetical protein